MAQGQTHEGEMGKYCRQLKIKLRRKSSEISLLSIIHEKYLQDLDLCRCPASSLPYNSRETSKTNRTSQIPPVTSWTHTTHQSRNSSEHSLSFNTFCRFSAAVSISRFDVHCRYAGVRGDHSKLLSQSDKSMSSSLLQFYRKILHLIAIDPHAELRTPQASARSRSSASSASNNIITRLERLFE